MLDPSFLALQPAEDLRFPAVLDGRSRSGERWIGFPFLEARAEERVGVRVGLPDLASVPMDGEDSVMSMS